MQDRLLILAAHWGLSDLGLDWKHLAQEPLLEVDPDCAALRFQFYRLSRKQEGIVLAEPPAGRAPTAAPAAGLSLSAAPAAGPSLSAASLSAPSASLSAPSASLSAPAASLSAPPPTDGLVVIYVPNIADSPKTEWQILQDLSTEYALPQEHCYALFQKIRIAKNILNLVQRKKLAVIRILAMAVCCMLSSKTHSPSQCFESRHGPVKVFPL